MQVCRLEYKKNVNQVWPDFNQSHFCYLFTMLYSVLKHHGRENMIKYHFLISLLKGRETTVKQVMTNLKVVMKSHSRRQMKNKPKQKQK